MFGLVPEFASVSYRRKGAGGGGGGKGALDMLVVN